MKYKNLKTWAKRLTMLSGVIAVIATIYALGAATPQEALASSHVESVPHDWSLKPSGLVIGDKFRLIFLSSEKRTATPTGIAAYNEWIIARAASGHADIREYSNGFKVVGCTAAVDARDSTATTGTGVPIYWLNGNKVADDYTDFYDGTWDDEANDKNELGTDAHDTSQTENYPYTGCAHNGTESFDHPFSFALGDTGGVRVARPNSTINQHGPLFSNLFIVPSSERPMYGLSKVIEVIPPGNAGTLTTGGTPRTGSINGSGVGEYWQVKLHKNGKYRIDVKGSESSQYGGTLTNPRIKFLAGSTQVKLLNRNSAGVSQTRSETLATGGGAGQNSRLDIKVTGETKYYYLLIHRGAGDHGSFTLTANRLDYPQGRLAPDIEVTREDRTAFRIAWTKPDKTHDSLAAPISGYKVQYRALPDGTWSTSINKDLTQLSHLHSGITQGQSYEVRVRSSNTDEHLNNTYRWGYATIHSDECAASGSNTCDINVNQSKKGRIGYDSYGDLDGYTVRLVSGRTYVIKANGKATNTGTLVDPYLEIIRASDDSLIREDDDGGSGFNSKITYTPTSTEDYNIVVSSAIDGRGTYRVKVTEK